MGYHAKLPLSEKIDALWHEQGNMAQKFYEQALKIDQIIAYVRRQSGTPPPEPQQEPCTSDKEHDRLMWRIACLKADQKDMWSQLKKFERRFADLQKSHDEIHEMEKTYSLNRQKT